jgi:hypothetical protein
LGSHLFGHATSSCGRIVDGYHCLFELLAATGLRIGEALNYRGGPGVDVVLPLLSTYLGHTCVHTTVTCA